jgi:amino acid adenylation domain-containing protein
MKRSAITTITEAFAAQVARAPDAPALLFRRGSMSYSELDARSNRIARWLRRRCSALETATEPLVPFCLPQGQDTVAVALAILRLGGAYVPIDPNFPPPRVRFMVTDTGARCIVTTRALARDLEPIVAEIERRIEILEIDAAEVEIAAEDAAPIACRATPDSLCYVMYTSGSTGRPKGVPVCHRGVTRLVIDPNYVDIRPSDCFAQAANVAFDAATFEIWGALLNGGRVALLPKDTVLDPERLAAAITEHSVTVMFLTTALFNQLVSLDPVMFGSLRYLLFGGEAASIEAVRRLLRSARPPETLLHVYGPTECTTFSTFHPVTRAPEPGEALSIGQAISHTTCFVVDSEMRLVEEGEGELLIGGPGLARGYLANPEETAKRYADNPFGDRAGKLYRTGDVVRRLSNGDLVFVGRVDNQVKIRGFRIELEEIELAMDSHPAVGGATIVVRTDEATGTKRLVAYLRPDGDTPLPSVPELRAFLEEKLPPYMVPSAFVKVPAFPLSPTGKVDRRALAAMPGETIAAEVSYRAPRTATETKLVDLWCRYLRLSPDQVGVEHDFFELGGHSLVAAQIAADLRNTEGVEIKLSAFWAAPTIAALAKVVEAAERAEAVAIPAVPDGTDVPLSWSQEQLWLHQQMDPSAAYYNEPLDITIPEALDVAAFERSLNLLCERHEALRLRVVAEQGRPRLRIAPYTPLALRCVDLRHKGRAGALEEALHLATEQAKLPFDLAADPPIRFLLVRLGDALWRLFMVGHHVALDGLSMFQVFFPELETAYRRIAAGQAPELPPLPLRLRDYVAWERDREPAAWAAGIERWRELLADLEPLPLPADRVPSAKRSFAGDWQRFALSHHLTQRLRDLSRKSGVSLFTTLLAAFKTLLFRYTHQADIATGTVLATRNAPGVDRLIGSFLNTLLLRTALPADGTFLDVLRAVRATCQEAFAIADIPFQLVARHASTAATSEERLPIQATFVLEPHVAASPSGWDMQQIDVHTGTAKFDLTFELDERPDHILGRVEYRTDLFEIATIQRMIRHFETLLVGICDAPDQPIAEFTLLDDAEQRRLLVEQNDHTVAYDGPKLLHVIVEEQADRTPDALAAADEAMTLSFRELDAQANRLAHRLVKLGAAPERLIGVWTDRSAHHLVALLGVLKAGAAYVPLASDEPLDRAGFILDDAGVDIVVCDRARRSLLEGHARHVVTIDDPGEGLLAEPASRPRTEVAPQNLAYVIYTSGSTGKPKGSMIEHRSIADRTHWAAAALYPPPGGASLQVFSLGFDGAISSTWWALASGAAVVYASGDSLQDPEHLAELARRHRATVLSATPTFWAALVATLARTGVRFDLALASGERMSGDLVEQLKSVAHRVVNAYGPTEATVAATFWNAPAHRVERPPIGTGIANTPLYVLDEHQKLLPAGVLGELYIGGIGVGRGYLKQPDLTEKSFVPDPFAAAISRPDARMYRTGDIVRWTNAGELEFLGRADGKVDVRRVPKPARDTGPKGGRVAPRNDVEQALFEVWSKVLGTSNFGVLDDFFDAGGDSIQNLQLVASANDRGLRISVRDVLDGRTIAELARRLSTEEHAARYAARAPRYMGADEAAEEAVLSSARPPVQYGPAEPRSFHSSLLREASEQASLSDPLVPLQSLGSRPPIFLVHPAGGLCLPYAVLLGHIDPELPVHGLNDPQFGAKERPLRNVAELAAFYVEAIARVSPRGPYRIGGWSFGAVVAHEMARQLADRGEEVAALVLLDDGALDRSLEGIDLPTYLAEQAEEFFAKNRIDRASAEARWFEEELRYANQLCFSHAPGRFAGRTVLVRAAGDVQRAGEERTDRSARQVALLGWEQRISGPIELRVLPGGHMEMLAPEQAPVVAGIFEDVLGRSEIGAANPDRIDLLNQLQLEAIERSDFTLLLRLQVLASSWAPRTAPTGARPVAATTAVPSGAAPRAPQDATVAAVASIVARALGRDAVPLDADFFALGGTSLKAVQVLTQIEREMGARIAVSALLRGASVERIAAEIRAATASGASVLIPFRTSGSLPPFFCVHPAAGSAFCYRELSAHLGPEQPFYGLEAAQGYEGQTIRSMAEMYVRAVREVAPRGPYFLGGWSLGGILAFEMARQLEEAGERVALVAVLDSRASTHAGQLTYLRHMLDDQAALLALAGRHIAHLAGRPLPFSYADLRGRGDHERLPWFLDQIAAHGLMPAPLVEGFVRGFVNDFRLCNQMVLDHRTPGAIHADILLLRATGITTPYEGFPSLEVPLREDPDPTYGFAALTAGTARVRPIDATHENIVFEPQVASVADVLRAALVVRSRAAGDTARDPSAFGALSAAQWRSLLEQMEPLYLAAGDMLLREGDPGGSFYLVAEGELEAFGRRPDGGSRHYRYIGPHTIVGEIGFVDGKPRTASVVALSRCLVYTLSMERFEEIRKSDPALASLVLTDIARAVTRRLRDVL